MRTILHGLGNTRSMPNHPSSRDETHFAAQNVKRALHDIVIGSGCIWKI